MLGRPARMLPVFIWQTPPTWFSPSAVQPCRNATSSTQLAISGNQSLTHEPDCPCRANVRLLSSKFVYAVRPIAVTGRAKLPGKGLPPRRFNVGFGSNRSIWLGPPSRKHQITDFAVGAKWGKRTVPIGFAAEAPAAASRERKDASASEPNPPPALARNSRRECAD